MIEMTDWIHFCVTLTAAVIVPTICFFLSCSRWQNAFAAGTLSRTPLGEPTALPKPLIGVEGLSLFQVPHPYSRPSAPIFGSSDLGPKPI